MSYALSRCGSYNGGNALTPAHAGAVHVGPSEAEHLWTTFPRDLVRRGLKGVKLVMLDAHEGLKAAVQRVLGATSQSAIHLSRSPATRPA